MEFPKLQALAEAKAPADPELSKISKRVHDLYNKVFLSKKTTGDKDSYRQAMYHQQDVNAQFHKDLDSASSVADYEKIESRLQKFMKSRESK